MAMTPGILLDCMWRGTRLRPGFVCAGFAKCGTTSLYGALSAHPQVCMPAIKELNYFTKRYRRGRRWYARQFPRRWEAARAGAITGDMSPAYIADKRAPDRIRRYFRGRAKFIVMVRNPVERAWSHYWHRRRMGEEPLEFSAAIERDWRLHEQTIAYREGRLAGRINVPKPEFSYDWNGYLRNGIYAARLRRLLTRTQSNAAHVIVFEELVAQPVAELDRLADFLGIETGRMQLPHLNAGDVPSMPEAERQRLGGFYAPHNAELAETIGRPLPWQ